MTPPQNTLTTTLSCRHRIKLINDLAEQGLAGPEWGAGVPGTIGGAVVSNAVRLTVEVVRFEKGRGRSARWCQGQSATIQAAPLRPPRSAAAVTLWLAIRNA